MIMEPHLSTRVQSTKQNIAQALLDYLELEGVDHVFGIPGGGVNILLTELKNRQRRLKYIICRHETGAAYIADGYFRATGKLAVVLVTTGPGATNALTGTMNAEAGGSAMLTITGEVDDQYRGKGYLQEGNDAHLNVNVIYSAATFFSSVINNALEFHTLMQQALRDALSIPHHAVHLSVPTNVSKADEVLPVLLPRKPENYRVTPRGVPAELTRQAIEELLSARRPLIFLGSGCREALHEESTLQALRTFGETYGIPVMTTPDGKGIFPEGHQLSLRVYGFASCTWPQHWMQPPGEAPYDALLVLGTSLRGLATDVWNPMLVPAGPFIQVDLQQNVIGRGFPVTRGIVGEVGAFIRQVADISPEYPPVDVVVRERIKFLETIKQNSPFYSPQQYVSEAAPIEPAALVRILQETLPRDSMIMLDAGNCVAWGIHYFVIDPPQEIHSSLAMGPMGFAVGAVVGAKVGQPYKTCVALVGDGAFMMHGAEVSTAKHYKVGAIWVVLYDDDHHMVSQGQTHYFTDENDPKVWERLYRLGKPDLLKFAEGLGADAYAVGSPAQLKQAMPLVLERAACGMPQVIVADIERSSINPSLPRAQPVSGGTTKRRP